MSVRLGYACINLSLQAGKDGPRLKGLTAKRLTPMAPEERRKHLYAVGRNNLKTLEAALRWNAEHGIPLFRLTSELIPLATHPVAAEWNWQEDLAFEFAACARLIAETGARVTTHPGQYTVLNAREAEVVERAVADLVYHAAMLDLLQTGRESGMVLHVGGGYGDKAAAAGRFIERFAQLPVGVADRLWLENDDTTWDTEEVLGIAEVVGRPVVFDIHHHRVLRDDDWRPWLEKVLPTWGGVRPKLHYSTGEGGPRSRHHAEHIDPAEFAEVLAALEGRDVDVMLECKAKDKALLELRRNLAALAAG